MSIVYVVAAALAVPSWTAIGFINLIEHRKAA